MTTKQKVKKTVELFEKIKKLWEKSNVSLSVHNVDMDNLPSGWEVKSSVIKDSGRKFWAAQSKKHRFDITLFD